MIDNTKISNLLPVTVTFFNHESGSNDQEVVTSDKLIKLFHKKSLDVVTIRDLQEYVECMGDIMISFTNHDNSLLYSHGKFWIETKLDSTS